jgi:polyisoprenoid-binding protein YceI
VQKSAKIALVAVIVIVLLGAGGFYWFVLRSDAPAEVTLRDRSQEAPASTATGPARATPDGTWQVAPDEKVFVGYRILEKFAGETLKKEAVGRTGGVTGTMTVNGQQVTNVTITADVSQLKSDQSRRDNFIRSRGLQTDTFKEATFTSTQPVQLPSAPQQGQRLTVPVTGDLTLHGQTKSVTIPVEAVWNGSTIDASGKVEIKLADYGIEKVEIPGITVDEQGTLEIALSFVPAAGS